MWGEFEDEEQDRRRRRENRKEQTCERPNNPSKPSQPQENTTKDDKDEDVYSLPLRNRLVHFMAGSNIEVKSQQKYEPDLTYEERKEIIEKLLSEKPGRFLYRFGKHLEHEHLQYFLQYEGDIEVDHYLAEALKNKNKHTAKITVRNRRYAALQQMRRSGDYFSEQEMERRDPLLYDHLIGQHQTKEEKEEKYNASTSETKFSSLLLHHMDNRAHKELKKRQEEEEDDMFEEGDTDEENEEEYEENNDDDDDDDAVMNSNIESREKQMFKEEFYSTGYNAFLAGQNTDFNYKEVDNNDRLDLLEIQGRDEEERYFDEEEEEQVSHHDMDYEDQTAES